MNSKFQPIFYFLLSWIKSKQLLFLKYLKKNKIMNKKKGPKRLLKLDDCVEEEVPSHNFPHIGP